MWTQEQYSGTVAARRRQARQSGTPPVAAVLFDMDNTLFDFIAAQLAACNAVTGHLGLSCNGEDLFAYFRRPVHGFEHHNNIRDFLSDNDAFTVRTFAECCAIYDARKLAAVRPYPGIPELLAGLTERGLPLAVVTDAVNGNAVRRLERSGLLSYFSAVASPDLSGAAKPDPASFRLALSRLGISPEEGVLVGDSIRRDIGPAQRLCMTTIYAQYGDRYAADRTSACMPDFTAADVSDVAGILKRLLMARNESGDRRRGS